MITGTQAILQKLVYVIGNLATVALALYKCSSMGLLPTYASDWLDFVEPAMVRKVTRCFTSISSNFLSTIVPYADRKFVINEVVSH